MGSGAISNPAAFVTGADTVPAALSRQQLSPPGVRMVAGPARGSAGCRAPGSHLCCCSPSASHPAAATANCTCLHPGPGAELGP